VLWDASQTHAEFVLCCVQVLEFRPADGSERGQPSVQQVTATAESLGLAPRDISLFADTGPGNGLAQGHLRIVSVHRAARCWQLCPACPRAHWREVVSGASSLSMLTAVQEQSACTHLRSPAISIYWQSTIAKQIR
jgi:hypothetical protein